MAKKKRATKEDRRKRREERRAQRQARRAHLRKIKDLAKNIQINLNTDGDLDKPAFVDHFNEFWPFMKEVFLFLKELKLTGAKTDKTLDDLVALGDRISKGAHDDKTTNEFVDKLSQIWKPIRIGLEIVIVFAPAKVDDVINKIIDIGDWVLESND